MANHLIGFLGGTFDPIHFGHLNLALEIAERKGLDKVLFCPAQISPDRNKGSPRASSAHRREMVERVIGPIAGLELCDLELKREGPSFTIDTIRALMQENPEGEYHLILGGDVIQDLLEWKEVEELLQLAPPFIGTRPNAEIPLINLKARVIPIPVFDISSTALRQRLKDGKYCGHLLPQAAIDYISTHQLYS